MTEVPYAVLPRAGANRVYGASLPELTIAELDLVSTVLLDGRLTKIERAVLGGVDYVTFWSREPLTGDELLVLSNISTLHALFERTGDVLRPVEVSPRALWDADILTIQRYPGKTNESFTQLLVNVTLAAAGDAFARMCRNETVRLLDPLCGRGTTLNVAVLYGLDAAGIELSRKDVDAYDEFIGRWLRDKRAKHQIQRSVHRKGRDIPVRRLQISYHSKERPEVPTREIDIVNADTCDALELFKPRSMDVVVADLPYGVQHKARDGDSARRRPAGLLDAALPVWVQLLRPNGAVGLSFNRKTLSRPTVCELLDRHGLRVVGDIDNDRFVHDVDRSITRDVIVATP